MSVTFRVSGGAQIAAWLLSRPRELVYEVGDYVRRQAPFWEALLRSTIQHVVYDAYRPQQYQRTGALLDAVESSVNVIPTQQVHAVLFDDPSKVRLRRGAISAGGTLKEDVPYEIEEGKYPQPWFGATGPRPAYLIFASAIRPVIEQDIDGIVTKVLT